MVLPSCLPARGPVEAAERGQGPGRRQQSRSIPSLWGPAVGEKQEGGGGGGRVELRCAHTQKRHTPLSTSCSGLF